MLCTTKACNLCDNIDRNIDNREAWRRLINNTFNTRSNAKRVSGLSRRVICTTSPKVRRHTLRLFG